MPKLKKLFLQQGSTIREINTDDKPKYYSIEDVRQMIKQRLYTLDLASMYLGIPVKTLREMISTGEIKFVKRESTTKSRRLYYLDKNDMDAWIDRNKQHYS